MRAWELIYETINTPVRIGKLRTGSSGYEEALSEEVPLGGAAYEGRSSFIREMEPFLRSNHLAYEDDGTSLFS